MTNGTAMPNPADLLQAPMAVLDAQVKAVSDQLSNLLNVGSTGVQSVFGVLQAPFAVPQAPDAVKAVLNAPMTFAKAVMAPFAAPAPAGAGAGAPAAGQAAVTPIPTFGVPPTQVAPPAIQTSESVISGVGGIFNIVKP